MVGVAISLRASVTASAVVASLLLAAFAAPVLTRARCPHGHHLYAKLGAWELEVVPVNAGGRPWYEIVGSGRGDILHCVGCRWWYEVIPHPKR